MKKTNEISFHDRAEYISDYLTHWTGQGKTSDQAFETLSIILASGELLFSSNKISFPDELQSVKNQMICFTDTPIRHAKEHCKKYGHFGISFNKTKLIRYGANPVLYLMDNRKSYYSYFLDLADALRVHLNNEQKLKFKWFGSTMQPFNTKPEDSEHFPEYFEREWRIAGRVLPFQWLKRNEENDGQHNEYNFEGKIRRQQNVDNINDEKFFLQFDKGIIENVVVPKNYAQQAKQLLREQNLTCELLLLI